MDETDLSAERAQAGQDTRLPQADVDQGWTSGDSVAPGEGTPPPVRVTDGDPTVRRAARGVGPIRSRQTFAALRHSSFRGRSGPLSVTYVQQNSWSGLQVAYAISRQVGNAVVRNRVRRRLRSIICEQAPSLPDGAYVVRTGRSGPSLRFDELKVAMSQALEKATRHANVPPSAPRPDRPGATK